MLPITSATDTYRVGIWTLRQNLDVVGLWAALSVGLWGAKEYLIEQVLSGQVPAAGTLEFTLMLTGTSLAINLLLTGILVVPLHAALLSDARVAGLRALADGAVVCRVAWRLFLIGAAVWVIFTAAEKVMQLLQAGGVLTEPILTEYAGPGGQPELILELGFRGVHILLYGFAVILLGLGIPRAVALGRAGPVGGSIRWGMRLFGPMAARLAAGPGIVLIVAEFAQWKVIAALPATFPRITPLALEIVSGLVDLAVVAFCTAMIAGVLSDGYRRALASAAESTGTKTG